MGSSIRTTAPECSVSRASFKLFLNSIPPLSPTDIEAECQDDYMKIRIGFNGSFSGLLYSAGYAYDPDCMYINGSGRDYYEFYIQLNRCGTLGKNSLQEESRKNPTVRMSCA